MLQVQVQKCNKCRKEKPVTEFHKRRDDVQRVCKDCRNAIKRNRPRSETAGSRQTKKTSRPADMEAMIERVNVLRAKIRSIALYHANDALDVDDFCQIMSEAIITKCSPEDTDAYILGCARMAARAMLEKRLSYNKYVSEIQQDGMEEAVSAQDSRTPEDEVADRESISEIMKIVSTLPVENQRVVWMLLDGYNLKEIAHDLGVTGAAVGNRVKRIRTQLSERRSPTTTARTLAPAG